jgi:hypothetical protein
MNFLRQAFRFAVYFLIALWIFAFSFLYFRT